MYGVACYKRHLKNGRGSRDAVMRSVGVMTEHFGFLSKHTAMLIQIATEESTAQLSEKAIERMTEYWRMQQIDTIDAIHANPALSSAIPPDAFSDLFAAVGTSIFTLWKAGTSV